VKIKQWGLSFVTALAVLITTPVFAISSCGNRLNLGKGPRLTILALTGAQRLMQFRECTPGNLYEIGAIYGLQSPDTALIEIDFRLQDGQLYGLGNGGTFTLSILLQQWPHECRT